MADVQESRGPSASDRNPRSDQAAGAIDKIRTQLAQEVGLQRFERYFQREARLRVDGRRLAVTVPSRFMADLLDRRFGAVLRKAAAESIPQADDPSLSFEVDGAAFGEATAAPHPENPQNDPPAPARSEPPRRPAAADVASRYRLEEYLVGVSNRVAFAAAVRLAEARDESLTRVFVHGSCGVGKTHLLHAIARRFRQLHPGSVARVVTGEDFTNEYISAVRSNRIGEFRLRYRGVDLLCIDDVHFVASKDRTQEELLHTLDALDLDGARLALASDAHPREIESLASPLVSRFLAGGVIRIDDPDEALRLKLIETHALKRGLTLTTEAIAVLASPGPEVSVSVREIEGRVTQLEAYLRLVPETLEHGAVSAAVARRAMEANGARPLASMPRRPIPFAVIAAEVCRELRVDPADLSGKGRHKRVVLARAACSYLARALTTLSFPEIAKAMGRPTHSTVISACKRLKEMVDADTPPPADTFPELAGGSMRQFVDRLRSVVSRAGAAS